MYPPLAPLPSHSLAPAGDEGHVAELDVVVHRHPRTDLGLRAFAHDNVIEPTDPGFKLSWHSGVAGIGL